MVNVDWNQGSTLCCCEYYDKDQERNHILGCCCNCVELDECCENLLCCKGVSMNQTQSVLQRIQDRFRIPWHGGAKQISLDAASPLILLPIFLLLATINVWISVLVGVLILILLRNAYLIHLRNNSSTKFFLMWTVTSIVIIWVIFEFKVQPFLEITQNENIVFNILFNSAIFCIYKIRAYATQAKNQTLNSGASDEEQILIDVENGTSSSEQFCPFCKCKKTERTTHCSVCQVCVTNQEYHNIWFDCCIGQHNRRTYMLFLILSMAALLYGSNLTLTTVCDNFVFFKTILLPNDCSEVYDQIDLTICFICGVYSLLVALFILWYLLQQCWFISLGITGSEWRKFSNQNRYGICISNRPHSQGFIRNWINFICKY